MKEQVKVVEVGPRDGLQNEEKALSISNRVELIRKLKASGLKHIEGGSFVSAKAVPQMENSEDVWRAFETEKNLELSFLVASEKGYERALACGVKSISVFTATSDQFNLKNIRRNVQDSLALFEPMVKDASSKGIRVRAYISTVFGCPYEGPQNPTKGIHLAEQLFKMGCYEVSVGDTIGVAHPKQVRSFFRSAKHLAPLAAHMHDTRGMAVANLLASAEEGIRVFDSSVGGLGGCPYAKGSSGNVATEEVLYLLEGLGFDTGVSLSQVLEAAAWIETKLKRPLKSKLYLAKPERLHFD